VDGADLVRGPRQEIQHRRPGALIMLIVGRVERRQDHRPAERVHDLQAAAAPQRFPGGVVNGRQGCRRTVESDKYRQR
jgi:hypothetical protein